MLADGSAKVNAASATIACQESGLKKLTLFEVRQTVDLSLVCKNAPGGNNDKLPAKGICPGQSRAALLAASAASDFSPVFLRPGRGDRSRAVAAATIEVAHQC
ncbi:MAG: hypothetical protein U0Z53_31760, partial [Blastocatellia bacterium]